MNWKRQPIAGHTEFLKLLVNLSIILTIISIGSRFIPEESAKVGNIIRKEKNNITKNEKKLWRLVEPNPIRRMRKITEYETTTNRSVYNKLHKEFQAGCSYCKWHGGENSTNKYYHLPHEIRRHKFKGKQPSWKLVSKNRKQWMGKPVKIKNFEITWSMKIRPK